MGAIPKRIVEDRELLTLPLDHREAFVLSHIDGATDVRTLIDVCAMTQDELVAVIQRLLSLSAIAWW